MLREYIRAIRAVIRGYKKINIKNVLYKMTRQINEGVMDIEIQWQIRSYLDTFYVAIYRSRLLIEMSKQIGNYNLELICQDLWGFFQHNLIVGAVVVEVFSLFDKKNNSMIKKFAKLLESNGQSYITKRDIGDWISFIEKYDDFRHKILTHKEPNPPKLLPVMYADFLKILDELDQKLLELESNHLKDVYPMNSSKIVSTLDLKSPLILQWLQVLSSNRHVDQQVTG